ncbi:MAG TPA: LysE family translocator [Prolixibacteraceae bacterium]|nr:LysE family translocator [Prolixibacteraceae bacterium]
MLIKIFWQGIIIGLSASIPLGPIGILSIQRTISKGRHAGFVSGLGAASADALYAIVAGFSISFIIDFITQYQDIIKVVGGAFLLFIGVKLFITNPAKVMRKQMKQKNKGLWGDFLSSFGLTFSNPITLFVFIAVFAGFGLIDSDYKYVSILVLISSVFFGASLWWFSLTFLVSIFRNKIKMRRLLAINKVAAVLIFGFGLFVIVSLFFPK